MNPTTDAWVQPWSIGLLSALDKFSAYAPRILGAILLWIVGGMVARLVRRVVVNALNAMKVTAAVEKTPFGLFLKNAEFSQKIEVIAGNCAYWLLQLLFLQAIVSMLGLVTLAAVFDRIFSYLPSLFAAFVIFVFGVVMAGVVESVVKGVMHDDVHTARLFAKVASYIVVSVAMLAAVSELGIASDFIRILFIGIVFAVSLAAGLALGLGSRDTIGMMVSSWYAKMNGRKAKGKGK